MRNRKRREIIIENIPISGLADKGRGVGRSEDGIVFFVEDALPGDVIDVRVIKQKEGFVEGIIHAIKTYSEHRVKPFCAHFGVCGGCKFQNLNYETQLHYKEDNVVNALKRIGKIEIGEFLPIVAADDTQYYRNKLEYTYSNKRWLEKSEMDSGISKFEDVLGFHRPGAFDKIVDITHCYLQPDPSNKIRNFAKSIAKQQGLTFFDLKTQEGFLRNILLRITTLGETLVIVSFYYEDKEARENFLNELLKQVPEITTLLYCVNPKANDFILDLDIITYSGMGYVEEKLGNVTFKIGPKSFFQTSTRQAEKLFDKVVEFADFKGDENVYDLYTGLGSIALYIAGKCKQVVGIEEIEAAIEDAKENAERNNITNTVFYAGDVKDILTKEFAEKHGKPDVLITDPPRAGMHTAVAEMLLQLEAPKIVYVSCNPATQARDLFILSKKYDTIKVQPVDMFPHTHHIENVALLKLRQ